MGKINKTLNSLNTEDLSMKLKYISITILLSLYSLFNFAQNQQAQQDQSKSPLAKIITLSGNVSLNEKIVSTQAKNTPLNAGDTLKAQDSKSFFIVEYSDRSRFMIRDGEINIKQLATENSTIKLLRGTIFSYVNPTATHKFKVETKKASFAVRGTKFWLQEDHKESYLCVCEGVVAVRNNNSLMLVNAGEDSHVANSFEALRKNKSNDLMWKMATEGFKSMGVPVTSRPK